MIRHATEHDLPRILAIYDVARQFMRRSGNMRQWINGYPSEPLLRQDIAEGDLYVMEDDAGIYAVFAFILGDDPTYAHRGVLRECVDWCAGRIPHLRIDTHADNQVMQRCILREGFSHCGVIYVADGSPREAFERIF